MNFEGVSGGRLSIFKQLFRGAFKDYLTSEFTRAWPDINNPVCLCDDVQIMFYHNKRIAIDYQIIQIA